MECNKLRSAFLSRFGRENTNKGAACVVGLDGGEVLAAVNNTESEVFVLPKGDRAAVASVPGFLPHCIAASVEVGGPPHQQPKVLYLQVGT